MPPEGRFGCRFLPPAGRQDQSGSRRWWFGATRTHGSAQNEKRIDMFPLERLSYWFFRLWHLSPHEFQWLANSWWRNQGKVAARCKVCGVIDWWPPAVPHERRVCFACFSSIKD
jgi:hypothetical protein